MNKNHNGMMDRMTKDSHTSMSKMPMHDKSMDKMMDGMKDKKMEPKKKMMEGE